MQLVAEGVLGKGGVVLRKPKHGTYITKITIKYDKVKGDKIKIVSDLPAESKETKKLTFTCEERPKKEFYEALKIITKTLINLCGLNADVWESSEISSISLKETEEGLDAAIALTQWFVDDSTTVTHRLKNVSFDLRNEINNLLAEAEDYIKGDRATKQISLFEQE